MGLNTGIFFVFLYWTNFHISHNFMWKFFFTFCESSICISISGQVSFRNSKKCISLWTWKSCWSTKTDEKAFIGDSTTAVNKVVLWRKKGGMFWCEVRYHLSCFEAPCGVFDNVIEQRFYEWAPVLLVCTHGHAHAHACACAFKWHGTPSCQGIHTIPLSHRWW